MMGMMLKPPSKRQMSQITLQEVCAFVVSLLLSWPSLIMASSQYPGHGQFAQLMACSRHLTLNCNVIWIQWVKVILSTSRFFTWDNAHVKSHNVELQFQRFGCQWRFLYLDPQALRSIRSTLVLFDGVAVWLASLLSRGYRIALRKVFCGILGVTYCASSWHIDNLLSCIPLYE